MKRISVLLVCLLFAVFSNSQEKYDSAKFGDIKGIASKIADVNVKALKKYGINKVMFAEFYGEFVTSKETSPSAFEQRNSPYYLERKSTLEFGSDYYETLTNLVFEEVKRVFKENNIEVLDKEILIANPDYVELGLKEEKSASRYTGGALKTSTTSNVIIRSVSGMGMYSNTAKIGAIGKINAMLPKICVDNGCQAAVTVKFKVGQGKDFRPTLDFLNGTLNTDIGEFNAGKGKKTYAFKIASSPLFTTKKGLISEADINGTEKGMASQEKYFGAFFDLVNGMCNSYSFLVKEGLTQ